MNDTPAEAVQPEPTHNDEPAIWPLVIADMEARDRVGREKYGTPLQTNNGRDALVDAYQEALDLVVYLRQELEERKKALHSQDPRALLLREAFAKLKKDGQGLTFDQERLLLEEICHS